MEKDTDNINDAIYSGAATFGRVSAWFTAVITSFFAAIMIYFGIKQLTGKLAEKGTVIQATKMRDGVYEAVVVYKYNGVEYTVVDVVQTMFDLKAGDIVSVAVKSSDNPIDVDIAAVTPNQMGWFMIGFAVLMLVFVWGALWLTYRFKFFAAYEGASTGIGLVKRLF